jgi:hypothetical protein
LAAKRKAAQFVSEITLGLLAEVALNFFCIFVVDSPDGNARLNV